MTYNVFGETLSLTQSINRDKKDIIRQLVLIPANI